jgi:hypothetical protein
MRIALLLVVLGLVAMYLGVMVVVMNSDGVLNRNLLAIGLALTVAGVVRGAYRVLARARRAGKDG